MRREDDRLEGLESLKAPERETTARLAFKRRILEAGEPLLARRRRPASSWDVLAAWARPGLVAAGVALLIVAGGLHLSGRQPPAAPVALEDVLASGDGNAVPALLVAMNEPDADAVVAAALEDRNGAGTGAGEETQQR